MVSTRLTFTVMLPTEANADTFFMILERKQSYERLWSSLNYCIILYSYTTDLS